MHCAACGFENPPGMRFCGGCGQPLGDSPRSDRRHITVMFCDLVGSTALSERLDPEDLADLIQIYQREAGQAIARYDGHIAQHLGDGLLVYFGYPVGHEDDARRAVHAGLDVIDALASVNATLDATRQLAVRIGIHSGPVVTSEIGSGPRQERLALGPTPNLAARLQNAAQPGTIVISRATLDLLKGAFACQPVGALDLKGFSSAVEAFRVEGAAEQTMFMPTLQVVGRDREADIIDQAFEAAAGGQLSAVLVTGEAGLGKSSLVHALRDRVVPVRACCGVGQCSAYETDNALQPVFTVCEQILGAALPEIQTLPDLTPQRRKELTLNALTEALVQRSKEEPVLLLIEDLHWADPSTIEFLGALLAQAPDTRLCLLMTSRPRLANPWKDDARVTEVALGPLTRPDVEAIVRGVMGDRAVPDDVLAQIVQRTDGIPLFAEELTKAVIESADQAGTGVTVDLLSGIPTSLQASLTARLDRLGRGRDLAQLASVIGREFTVPLLTEISPWPPPEITEALDRLEVAGLIFREGALSAQRYLFKHALIRDAAYEMLLRSARRDAHLRIADALLQQFPETAAASPGLVARHLTEADQGARAIPYWITAGQKATNESANLEAIANFRTALGLIEGLPSSVDRDLQELQVHLAIAPPLTMTRGFVVDEVEQAYLQAQAINERVGAPEQRFWVSLGLCQFRLIRGEIEEARTIASRLSAVADTLDAPVFKARALTVQGITDFYAGRFRAAQAWHERALAAIAEPDPDFLNFIGLDLGAVASVYAAMSAWHLGDTDRALALGQDALTRARATNRPNALAHAMVFGGGYIHHFRREPGEVLALSTELAELSAAHGFPIWSLQAGLWSMWAGAMLAPVEADPDDPMPPTVKLIRAYQATGAGLALGYYITLAAETLWRQGRLDLAETLIDEALALNAERADPMWNAEVERFKGELTLARGTGAAGSRDEAARWFSRAMDTARAQESRALEQRAAASLAALNR